MKSTDCFLTTKKPWSEIKDRLLESYLVPYFQKILTNKKPITYIDCFAGKGMFDDGSSGSPIIALNVRDKCLDKSKVENHCFNTIFIEPKYYIDLKEKIRPYSRNNCSIYVIEGKYEEKINEFLSKCQNHNVFLYLDPYGIKPIDSFQFKAYNKGNYTSFEMLINFNFFLGFF